MEGEGGWFPRRRSCQAGGEAPDAGSSPRAKAKQVSGGDESCQPASVRRIRSDQRLTEVPAPLWAGPGWWDTHAFVGEPPPSQLHTPRQLPPSPSSCSLPPGCWFSVDRRDTSTDRGLKVKRSRRGSKWCGGAQTMASALGYYLLCQRGRASRLRRSTRLCLLEEHH